MARFSRAIAVGAAHHITQRGVDQQRVFFTDADRHTYLDCLQTYSAQARLRILAYCLMSNHIHLVAIPDEPQSLAMALRRTHGRYALYLNSRRHRVGHLWQNRFYSWGILGESGDGALNFHFRLSKVSSFYFIQRLFRSAACFPPLQGPPYSQPDISNEVRAAKRPSGVRRFANSFQLRSCSAWKTARRPLPLCVT